MLEKMKWKGLSNCEDDSGTTCKKLLLSNMYNLIFLWYLESSILKAYSEIYSQFFQTVWQNGNISSLLSIYTPDLLLKASNTPLSLASEWSERHAETRLALLSDLRPLSPRRVTAIMEKKERQYELKVIS